MKKVVKNYIPRKKSLDTVYRHPVSQSQLEVNFQLMEPFYVITNFGRLSNKCYYYFYYFFSTGLPGGARG
ncbi:hypothetical protein Dalk_1757 [Desulfatibacillum aliphaticivorans]|uniref:Uncharacterized protein n=1 Tax=Desulfatibacillum aliphaticivorans TaxID=218208 RepID=B8FFP9_DESAL|nr:hypothetical protein Dalk_1757 [Desulfatibacillum aliphaticivorans]